MFKGVDHGSDTYRACWEGDEYQEEVAAWYERCIKRSQDYAREQRETARQKQLYRVLDRACLAGLTLSTAYLIIRTIIG